MPARRTITLPSEDYVHASILDEHPPITWMDIAAFVLEVAPKVFPYVLCFIWGYLVAWMIFGNY